MFNCTCVFYENYKSTERIKVNQGGTSSGKTYAIMQLLFLKAIENALTVITVVGQDIPNLKKGAYRDAKTIISNTPELRNHIEKINDTDRIIYFKNLSLIEFTSYKDGQDAKSGKRDILFVNEANGIPWEIYWQLDIRTRKEVFIDYNPTVSFWVHDRLIGRENVRLIISDHRHNSFLSQEEHDKIEGIEDREYWKVYARGMTGKVEGLLFPESDLRFEEFGNIDFDSCQFAFCIGDPADKGGDYYAMPFCFVFCNDNDLSVFVHNPIFNRDGVEANTDRINDRLREYNIERVFLESNGGWVSSAILLKSKIANQTKVTAYTVSINKLVRILSNYEFIKRHFVFDSNYRGNPEYKEFMVNLTSFKKDGKNLHDDAPDILSAAANVVKIKYKSFLYG